MSKVWPDRMVEPTIYYTQGEYVNHDTTDVSVIIWSAN